MSCERPLKRISTVLLVLLLFLGLWAPVHALDGKELASLCDKKKNPYERGVCIGYTLGVAETLTQVLQYSGVCGPEGATTGQLRPAVVKYLNDHPQHLQESAVNLVWSALVDAWPCPGMKSP